MHVELVAIAVLVVLVVMVAIRIARANAIERSISGHHRRLHQMEEVVHRSREQRGQIQARPLREYADLPPDRPAARPARIDIDDDVRQPVSEEGRLVFGDLSLTPVRPPVPPVYPTRADRRRTKRGATRISRALVIGPAVVVMGAGGGAYAWWTSRHHTGLVGSTTTTARAPARSRSAAPHRHRQPRRGGTARPHTPSTTTAVPLAVLSTTATSATVRAPAGTYQVVINASAPCWVGFERSKSPSGPWLADATIGTSASSSESVSASGPLVVAIGAPKAVTSIEVNGVALSLGSLPPESYDLYFTSTSS